MAIVARYPRNDQLVEPINETNLNDILAVYDELRELGYNNDEISVIARNSYFFAQYKVVNEKEE